MKYCLYCVQIRSIKNKFKNRYVKNIVIHFQMQAIQQKRILAFVNNMVMTNLQCLNNFTEYCETKLMQFEEQLDKMDATMVLMESKVCSRKHQIKLIPTTQSYKT